MIALVALTSTAPADPGIENVTVPASNVVLADAIPVAMSMVPPGAMTEIVDPLGVALIFTVVALVILIPPLPPTIKPLIETVCALIDTPFAVMPPEAIVKLEPPDSALKEPPPTIDADTLIVLAVKERFPEP